MRRAWTGCRSRGSRRTCRTTCTRSGIGCRREVTFRLRCARWRYRSRMAAEPGCSGCRRRRHSHRSSSDDLGFVVVTHPFHPLIGQRLEVLVRKRRGADEVFVCEGGVGGQVTLSRTWTDRGHRRGRSGCRSRVWPSSSRRHARSGVVDRHGRGETLLCDEYTQDGLVEDVHADAAGSAASVGGPAGRGGAAAGRVAGGADPAVRQGRLPVRRGRTARSRMCTSRRRRLAGGGCGTCRRRWSRWCAAAWPSGVEIEAVLAEISAINAELLARRELG